MTIKIVELMYARGWEKKRQKSCRKMIKKKARLGEYQRVLVTWYVHLKNHVMGLKIYNKDV